MKREDIIREIQSMLPEGQDGYQVAKSILKLSELPAGTFRQIGKARRGGKRPMSQGEAARIVAAAIKRIGLADDGETSVDGTTGGTARCTRSRRRAARSSRASRVDGRRRI